MKTTSWQNEYAPRTILVIEDNEDDLLIVSRHIKKIWSDSKVLSAPSLADAYSLCQKNHFELVLLDLNLPDSHGARTIQEFQKFNMGARIVAITGMDIDYISSDAKNFGADALISKARLLSDDFVDHLLENAFNIPPIALASRNN